MIQGVWGSGSSPKVYQRKKQFAKLKAAEIPTPLDNQKLDTKELANWPAIQLDTGTHYNWNPFKFVDGATGKELERPIIAITGKDGVVYNTPDPRWCPIDDKKRTLVMMEFMFGVFQVNGNVGVKVIPMPRINIFKQVDAARTEMNMGMYAQFASGVGEKRKIENISPDAPAPLASYTDIPMPGQAAAAADYDDEYYVDND